MTCRVSEYIHPPLVPSASADPWANGEREAALVLEEEGAEAAVAREGVGAHREDVHVAVPDPRNLRFRGEDIKRGVRWDSCSR